MLSIILKYVLPALGGLALMFGIYEYGHSNGYTSGHTDGYQTAWNTQQKTINKMVTDENKQAQANNKAISDVEIKSQQSATKVRVLQEQLAKKNAAVVTKYVNANPQTSQTCGFDVPMVNAINELLDNDPDIVAKPVAPAAASTPATTQ